MAYNMPKCESCGFGNTNNPVRRYAIANMPVIPNEIDWNGEHNLCDDCVNHADLTESLPEGVTMTIVAD